MKKFEPDYNNILNVALNKQPDRIPLYEHWIDLGIMEKITSRKMSDLYGKLPAEQLRESMVNYCLFWKDTGYDTVTWENCVASILPGGGALGGQQPGCIKNRADFDAYPWDKLCDLFFDRWSVHYELLRDTMPEGMKAIGGVGNGVFECVQDLVGFENLCMLRFDDPQLYADLFKTIGDVLLEIWQKFLTNYSDVFCVCRFGDDLAYTNSTMLQPDDIRNHIIPQYKRIVEAVHAFDKPFLLHSCGNIFCVMDDIIEDVKIDAKHSNEDAIAPFSKWIEDYGKNIGNFGGVDMDVLCRQQCDYIRKYTLEVLDYSQDSGGVAYGTGNSIPYYVPVEGYMTMINTVREYRGNV